VLRERVRFPRGNRPAPLDQTIAVSDRVAPVDAEGRAFSSSDLRERALAQDRDELLAERKLPLHVDVPLEAEQAPLGHLPHGGDFVHDRPLPAQSADEVVGQLAPRVVCHFGAAPVLSDACRRIGRIAREQLPDRRKRQLQLTHHHDKACLVELAVS
jgi:hypothetical protein